MRQLSIALGACVAALAVTAGPALAQNSTPSTYKAARAAGAAAQKVAPPNLVLPADMGGGTYSQRMTSTDSTTTTPNATPNSVPPSTPNNIGPGTASPADNSGASKPSTPANGPPNNGNNTTSPNTKPGG
ncbi:MAG TPA: hypothetical protein VGG22_01510 [Candidatus Baltobacteraceae bacterium]